LGNVPVALNACIEAGDPPFSFKRTVWGDGEEFIVRTTSKEAVRLRVVCSWEMVLMTTEATFPPFTTDGLFAEEAALFDAIVSIVMALVVMLVLSVFIWRLIYRVAKDM
tara:strand:+ start:41 stop:367 length:327 start_codon:yes stop_codon:yes gene_type:complete